MGTTAQQSFPVLQDAAVALTHDLFANVGKRCSALQDAAVALTHELFANVGKESYPETDISAEHWLRNKGADDKVLAIADACYANDFGCSLHQLGLREMITENQKWDSGMINSPCIDYAGYSSMGNCNLHGAFRVFSGQ